MGKNVPMETLHETANDLMNRSIVSEIVCKTDRRRDSVMFRRIRHLGGERNEGVSEVDR